MAVLIDTSFLVALAVPTDRNYRLAQAAYPLLNTVMVLPIPVLPELFYMVMTRVNYATAVRSYNFLNGAGFQVEALTPQDRNRMSEIMDKYADVEFDFVDMAIMALSERLNITRVCTFDRRDFSIYRPSHCDYLELLP
ncbi:MAG: PIN domain-containing protein [Burkholderiales bacterium]|nr:PIN domain-containing protein [Anaerolineae bacterium]